MKERGLCSQSPTTQSFPSHFIFVPLRHHPCCLLSLSYPFCSFLIYLSIQCCCHASVGLLLSLLISTALVESFHLCCAPLKLETSFPLPLLGFLSTASLLASSLVFFILFPFFLESVCRFPLRMWARCVATSPVNFLCSFLAAAPYQYSLFLLSLFSVGSVEGEHEHESPLMELPRDRWFPFQF